MRTPELQRMFPQKNSVEEVFRTFRGLQPGDVIYLNNVEIPFVVTDTEHIPTLDYRWLQLEHQDVVYATTVTPHEYPVVIGGNQLEFTVTRVSHLPHSHEPSPENS